MRAVDVSNYTVTLTPEVLAAWQDAGIGLVVIQCFPPSYAQYATQREQMRACAAAGMPWDAYIYDYLADPTWRNAAMAGLTQAHDEEGLIPRKLWLDEEDVETEQGWTPQEREQAVVDSYQRAFGWGRDQATIVTVGIYTSAWWYVPKTGNSDSLAHVPLWTAEYDNVADAAAFTAYGGWESCRIKQFAGSQPDGTDLNVLSEDEAAELAGGGTAPVDDAERDALQSKIDALVNSLGYIGGDVLKPLTRKTAGAYVKTAVAQIRAVCDQHGINHA